MKTSAVLASLLFGSFAVAAPFDKRALVYKTQVVTETVVVYTTVWDDDEPVAQATTTPAGYFYEVPKAPSSAPAKPTAQAPANPPAADKPSSTFVAPAPQAPTTTPTPTPSPAPVVEQPKPVAPAPVVEQPKPVEEPKPATTTSAYVAPAAAPAYTAPSTPSTGGSSGAMEHQNVDITIYDNTGAAGACGKAITDTDMVVALAAPTWGKSTYDVMTGEATNPWCGQKIDIEYNGNHIQATIMDLCPGCSGSDIDLSLAAWKALTKLDEKTRLKASWSKIS
ncbi:hypothetical protein DE146DRAFT_663739 [Phaeosphaeria sp. MPI-PUGE-AT-0046c]|nr:hypothetical protein DE146DRAFT_663739 [Phaeosphaeria sp. MPI-PUGE-AT-0046c]